MPDTNTLGNEPKKKTRKLQAEWNALENKKTQVVTRSEEYAGWTLPHVFPRTGHKDSEMQGPTNSTGSRAVNHLANKLTMTLFQPHSPFFRLKVSTDVTSELEKAAEAGDDDAKIFLAELDKELAKAERNAMTALDYNRFRTEATSVAKSLIITGNALIYHPVVGKVQAYSLRDYCVQRDLSGTVIKIITRDKKAYSTFSEAIKKLLSTGMHKKKYVESTDVTVYTVIELEEDGKYHMTQAADEIPLDSDATWTPDDMPYIALTWNLVRGEDYGRGLVEDYAGAFHALHVLNNSLLDMAGIASDIKFLVSPKSMLDVVELNKSPSGSYHSGEDGDITTPQLNKQYDMQFIESTVIRFEKQIGEAFLLNTSAIRDAERVTAEEVRQVAQELELSHGGIYSRFAEEWQLKTAVLMLKRIDLPLIKNKKIYPQIITGLDSLSRAGDLDNLRMFISDLQLLQAVPDELRATFNPRRFAEYVGIRRGVEYDKFLKTDKEIQQDQAAQQQMIDQQAQAEAGVNLAAEAGKAAFKQ